MKKNLAHDLYAEQSKEEIYLFVFSLSYQTELLSKYLLLIEKLRAWERPNRIRAQLQVNNYYYYIIISINDIYDDDDYDYDLTLDEEFYEITNSINSCLIHDTEDIYTGLTRVMELIEYNSVPIANTYFDFNKDLVTNGKSLMNLNKIDFSG